MQPGASGLNLNNAGFGYCQGSTRLVNRLGRHKPT